MNNEIGRKITSLTLMTIMLAGGMTIGFSGFTPDAYAANANLIVSAENTGYVAGAQVIEILVIDDDLGDDALPIVTVNGDAVLMTKAVDSNYYAYIADASEVALVTGIINFGTPVGTPVTSYTSADGAVAQPVDDDATGWPTVQVYEFSSNIVIQYNKAGGTQITTLQFDDNAGGLSLDRSIYPSGATMHVTIDDHRLNIDPTSDDVWTWNIDTGEVYRNLVLPVDGAFATTPVNAASVCAACTLEVTYNRSSGPDVIEIASTDGITLPSLTDNADTDVNEAAYVWFTAEEDGGPNTGVFTATDLDDDSIVKIAGNAPRDSAAIITYDDTDSGILVKHSEATIDIQSPDDVWTSGLAIPIAIVDGDVNKNSQASDDVVLTDPNSIIPTLVTGDPFTLGEDLSNPDELTTWVGQTDIDPVEHTAIVEQFSDRAILSFTESYATANFLVIDIPARVNDLRDTLIDTSDDTEHGFNMLNYNVESLEVDLESIQIISNEGNVTITGDLVGTQFGYINISDLLQEDSDDDGEINLTNIANNGLLQLRLNFADSVNLIAEKEYPIVIDFFSFGFENDGAASDERIANQIIRLLLEESDSNTASLEGTLEYVMINQLNINDLDTYTGITTVGLDTSFIVIEDLTSGSAPSVTYLDVDTTGTQTQVSAQEDAPSHSAVVSLDVESFKTADTVTVTLEDLDLNTDSGLPDIYTVVTTDGDANRDAVGSASEPVGTSVELADRSQLGRMLDITFDDERWMTQMWFNTTAGENSEGEYQNTECTNRLLEIDDEYRTGSRCNHL